MKRLVISFLLTLLLLLGAGLAWLGLSESGLQWSYRQFQPWIPGELSVKALNGRWLGRIRISGLDYHSPQVNINVDEMDLDAQLTNLLFGHIDIQQLTLQDLIIRLPNQAAGEDEPFKLPAIELPWRISLHQLEIDGLILERGETSFPIETLNADVESWLQQVNIHQLQLETEQYGLDLQGYINLQPDLPHKLNLAWTARLPSADELSGEGSFEGDLQRTRLEQHLLAPSRVSLEGSLTNIINNLAWQVQVSAQDFDHRQWKQSLPELRGSTKFNAKGNLQNAAVAGTAELERSDTGPLSADYQLQLSADGRIDIQALELKFTDAAMQLAAEGEWQPGQQGGQVDLALQWQNLQWPLDQPAWFNSERGQGHVNGGVNDYRFQIQTSRPRTELPESSWQAEGTGNLRRINFEQLNIDKLDGRIQASGELDWQDTLSWQAEVSATDINPGVIDADWPGKLTATLVNSGSLSEGKIDSQLQVTNMDGELRGYPVALSSNMQWNNDGLDIANLDFRSGSSSLQASGRIEQNLALDWRLDSTDLAELLPDTRGQLQATGKLLGSRQRPQISARVNGKNLLYQDYQAAAVDGDITVDLSHWQDLEVDLQARALRLPDVTIDRLEVSGSGRSMLVNADVGEYKAMLKLIGSSDSRGWQGQLREADMTLGSFDQWTLQQPLAISLQDQRVSMQQGCWSNPASAMFCVEFNGSTDDWKSSMRASAIPLQYLKTMLPDEFQLDSTFDAMATLRSQRKQILGEARVELAAGSVSYAMQDGETERWTYQSAQLRTELTPQGIESSGDLLVSANERLQLQLSLPRARLPDLDIDTQSVRGEVDVQLDDLSFMGLLLTELRDIQGRARASMLVSGTLAKPVLNGQFSLQQGQFALPRLGLSITEVNLTGQSQGLERMDYQLSALSGKGRLDIQGVVEFDDLNQWSTRMTLKGNNFEVARIPEAQIQASPDLQVQIKPHRMEISGTVTVPYAHLEPRDVSTAVRVSNDVVIIGAEQAQSKQWSIVSNIQVKLGERVHFFGYGLEGRLGGQLQIEEQPDLPTRASGEINFIDGRYQAYGQRLDIDQGRLIFTGGPLVSPGLDVRAVRQINEITVGIRALGTITEPQIELFSSPAMGQTDILSYLLLGRPIENASNEEGAMMAKAALALGLSGGDRLARNLRDRFGLDEMRLESSDSGDQASLVLGRYLSPRLYVSYGIGLIEAFNTYIVRYQLSTRWQLKAESGEAQSADLIYTIER